ncbi:hypothetical protein ET008_08970 [Lactococcus garvieae]|nr:hypothetical protein [Lactococcus garvieae]
MKKVSFFFTNISMYKEKKKKENKIEREDNICAYGFLTCGAVSLALGKPSKGYRPSFAVAQFTHLPITYKNWLF